MCYNYIATVGASAAYKLITHMNISFLINYIVTLMIHANCKGSDYSEHRNVATFIPAWITIDSILLFKQSLTVCICISVIFSIYYKQFHLTIKSYPWIELSIAGYSDIQYYIIAIQIDTHSFGYMVHLKLKLILGGSVWIIFPSEVSQRLANTNVAN